MLALAFLQWWYGPGWARTLTNIKLRLRRTYFSFSVPQLLRTLVAPWRRIVTPGGGSIGERLRAMVDNTLSRIIGAIVRLLTIVTAVITMLFWIFEGVIMAVVWPVLPVAAIGFIVWGFIR